VTCAAGVKQGFACSLEQASRSRVSFSECPPRPGRRHGGAPGSGRKEDAEDLALNGDSLEAGETQPAAPHAFPALLIPGIGGSILQRRDRGRGYWSAYRFGSSWPEEQGIPEQALEQVQRGHRYLGEAEYQQSTCS